MGNVVAFKPKRLEHEFHGTNGKQPKVIFTEMGGSYAHTFNDFIMIGENAQGEIQAINCGFDKLCSAIEFLMGQAVKTVNDYHVEADRIILTQLMDKMTKL